MTDKIFRSTFFTSLIVLLASLVLIMGVLFGAFENRITEELGVEAQYVSQAVESEGAEFLNNLSSDNRRITLISKNGDVIADTHADARKMKNHSNRTEFKQALKDGTGTSVHYSDTLTEKTVYFARRLENGDVLRISTTMYTVISILLGLMQPEKAANWANPYFLDENENGNFDNDNNADFLIERNSDGEATVFSMINGLTGVPLISGRIDCFDELNFKLAKEAVDCYKRIRDDVAKSYAVYPTGTALVGNRSFVTLGLADEKKTQMYLAVWKVNAFADEIMIDLSKYAGDDAEVEMIYPKNDTKCEFAYAKSLKKLTVKLAGTKYMARMFKIKL